MFIFTSSHPHLAILFHLFCLKPLGDFSSLSATNVDDRRRMLITAFLVFIFLFLAESCDTGRDVAA
jgi:hypothetical protein